MSDDFCEQITPTERQVIERQIIAMQDDLTDIKGSMRSVADALTKLAVLEEKHQTVALATNKILERLERMEKTQSEAEFSTRELTRLFAELKEIKVVQKAIGEKMIRNDVIISTSVKAIKVAWVVLGSLILWVGGKVLLLVVGTI